MAIVEDDIRNESEDENEIEVVVEEDDGDSDDDDEEELLEKRVADLERQLTDDPYNYDDHIELIQSLRTLTDLDRWRSAYERLQEISVIRAEHWLTRLQNEQAVVHSGEMRDKLAELFQQAALDCYSVPIFSEWCTWSMANYDVASARLQLDEVLRRAGADPLSGKIFWDTKLELEKAHLDTLSKDSPDYKAQQERILWCLEEIVSRPLLHGEESWQEMEDLATILRDKDYIDKVKKQHDAAMEYLQKLTPYEDKLLTLEDPEEKCKVYQEYIDTVKDAMHETNYSECDSNGVLKVLYDRASYECLACEEQSFSLLVAYARHAHACSSRATYRRVLDACTRRCPRRHTFWTLKMQQLEHEERDFDEVKAIFETGFAKGMESYKQAESLWMSYLEFVRRRTKMENESELQRLRWTFQMAWDSLAEAWGDEANDCEVPLYWARFEYKFTKDPKQGKRIFEEIFSYGDNKTMSKYWEALINLEMNRSGISEHKLRELMHRALRSVKDYPPAVARLWTDYERDYGTVDTVRDCTQFCEEKIKEWRENYQAMKDNITGKKQKGKQIVKNKPSFEKRKIDPKKNKGKRKADESEETNVLKKKKHMEESESGKEQKETDRLSAVKRSHEEDNSDVTENKRQRIESTSSDSHSGDRDACTLFVSNLDFKVSEGDLREKLSEYGDIVSLRLRAGVKAFGGSICYCQYKTAESVEEALKHDRTSLKGRPMFLSRYSANKSKQSFKYSTVVEKNKLFVKNLSYSHCNQESLMKVFDKYGKLKDIRIVTFKDGKPKGLAYIEYEDEQSAAEALEKTNGLLLGDRNIEVAISAPPPKSTEQGTSGTNLGQPKRDTGGMRRTQLSSFIPSVLQKASTSKATVAVNGSKSLNNSDFRNMLLGNK